MDVKVDIPSVQTLAGEIETCKTKVEQYLNAASTQMSGLSSTWTGSGAIHVRTNYRALGNTYADGCVAVINQHASFLTTVVGTGYTDTESALEKYASAFI